MLPTIVLSLRRSLLAALCLAGTGALLSFPAQAARPVLKYKSEIALKASPQKAWDSFKTFSAIHTWHPATEGTKLLVGQDGKALAVREFQLKGGGFVMSELLSYSPQALHLPHHQDQPATGQLRGRDVDEAGSRRRLGGALERQLPTPRRERQARPGRRATAKLIQGVFKAGLDNIAAIAAR